MVELGLVAKAHGKARTKTDSNHTKPVAPNILDGQFNGCVRNEVWVMDITYLTTTQGWLYLAVVMDLYSRMVVDWCIEKHRRKEVVMSALDMAVRRHSPSSGLICHSDRGSQYCSNAYQEMLDKHGFICSMSRKGKGQDNACTETFFHSLKVEWIYGEPAKPRRATIRRIREYIEIYYNRQRLHSSNGYLSPQDFEKANEFRLPVSA